MTHAVRRVVSFLVASSEQMVKPELQINRKWCTKYALLRLAAYVAK